MSNGIYGYNAARINAYRPVEKAVDTPREQQGARSADTQTASAAKVNLGADLSPEEARMISQHFPSAPQMTLRLYGPGRQAQALNPNGVGSRLDIKG